MVLANRHKVSTGFGMSSMTDLVFLLLIFFILVSTLVSPYALPVDLPMASAMPRAADATLRIGEDGSLSLNGAPVSRADLEVRLVASLGKGDNGTIALNVEQGVPTGRAVEVLDMAKRHRWRIALATAPR